MQPHAAALLLSQVRVQFGFSAVPQLRSELAFECFSMVRGLGLNVPVASRGHVFCSREIFLACVFSGRTLIRFDPPCAEKTTIAF